MNHNVTLAIAAIVAATALTAIPFAIPQQALAGGQYYKHNNHNSNSIKVDQQINQQNNCSTSQTREFPPGQDRTGLAVGGGPPGLDRQASTVCLNIGDNSADIHK
ncbi:MAG: hypothetical protein M3P08_14775 [Thermoproteota archaeon]|jgi:hypothetical protein|nr:hypothetical protein [Thermoproteota archaeon]